MDLTFFQLGELSFYGKKVFTILQKVFQLSLFYQNELSLNDIIGGTQQKYTFKTSNVSSNENIILQGLTCSWIIVQQLPEENEVLTWNKLIMSHFLITKQLKACYVSVWTPFIQLIDNRSRRIVGEGNFKSLRKTHKYPFSFIIPAW